MRDSYSTREIELIPEAEMPTRFAKQLASLASAFVVINEGSLIDDDRVLLIKIVLDTLSKNRKLVIQELLKNDILMTTGDIATDIGLPTNTTRRILEDLAGLGIVERDHHGPGHEDLWCLNEKYIGIISFIIKTLRNTEKNNTLPENSTEDS